MRFLPGAPPPRPAEERVPALVALATAVVGAINIASALTPELPSRVDALLTLAPVAEIELARSLAFPAGVGLLAAAWLLFRRRRRAAHAAIALLLAMGAVDLLKGLDVEEALLSWALAGGLWRWRDTFHVISAGLPPEAAVPGERSLAAAVVRRHGADTLAAFKLRGDLQRRWSRDGGALAGYCVRAGTLLLAGDPVGTEEAKAALLQDAIEHARGHGLALGVVAASAAFADIARESGLYRLYMGDEALVATGPMDLSSPATKTLRKAVGRVARHGYRAELLRVADLDADTLGRLEAVSEGWRAGVPERGFSMAHDRLDDELLPDALVVLARDRDGAVRGFLHFVPTFGRAAASLGFMRRDRDTPNGLTEFLVVESARLLGEAGLEEFSLNFATFGRWLRAPANALERALARLLRVADRWFQIERLHRFNARFAPRWEPRYLLFSHPLQLPRVGLATLWAEGWLPAPPSQHALRKRALEVLPARAFRR
ncbi:bifunctional lysylphosphatidylglycerol flippase/synthetase MprF [Candidatus Solirubrobacter pratensis]|uniref:bifunctional lysylphosphatidylglycerol flippase/synthetase MprF n=1 Tax=Candidatus Solirubrobacter pratensis TaxID=1298857 RepID=UPI000687FA4F|nr:phosphatidylglycerol lysyltransferase domain-containing protein [Candidatus Solirubrobacter pratensis]